MKRAIKIAKKVSLNNILPIASVIVNNNFEIGIGINLNSKIKINKNHSESNAIQQGLFYSTNTRLNMCTIYSTLEPCFMCIALIASLKIKNIAFSTYRNKKLLSKCHYAYKKYLITGGVLNKNNDIIKNYFFLQRKCINNKLYP